MSRQRVDSLRDECKGQARACTEPPLTLVLRRYPPANAHPMCRERVRWIGPSRVNGSYRLERPTVSGNATAAAAECAGPDRCLPAETRRRGTGISDRIGALATRRPQARKDWTDESRRPDDA
jgi:hypothetical protein